MKNRIFTGVAILALATSIGLTSCSTEDPAKAVDFESYLLEQGSIEGFAYADYDDSSSDTQYAPAGTKLFLTISYEALGIDNAYNGETVRLQTTVNSSGKFTFSDIPLNRYKATIVRISGQPFVKGYTYYDFYEDEYVTRDHKFSASVELSVLQPGSKNFVTLTYNPSELFE